MALNLGSTAVTALKVGSADVSKVMLGDVQVWPAVAQVPWTPAELGVKLAGWYRSDGPFTTAAGIAQWSDSSGKDNHLIQQDAAAQPVLGTFEGRPAVVFDGSDDHMTTTLPFNNTFCAIACFGYPNNNSTPPFAFSNDGVSRKLELHLNGEGVVRGIAGDAGPYADTPPGTPQSFYDNCIISVAYNTAQTELTARLNGQEDTVQVNPDNTFEKKMQIGMRGGKTFFSESRFTEIIFIADWTQEEVAKVEGYLAWKYKGLPLSRLIDTHPYKNAPPTK